MSLAGILTAPGRRARQEIRVRARVLAGVTILALGVGLSAGPAEARSRRASRPPNVAVHPDRGMGFTRFSKTSHDQKLLSPLNQGTKLPGVDPSIDPYNLGPKPSTYDIQTGTIHGSLGDHDRDIRRAEDAARRNSQQAAEASRSRLPAASALPTMRSLLTTTQRNLARPSGEK